MCPIQQQGLQSGFLLHAQKAEGNTLLWAAFMATTKRTYRLNINKLFIKAIQLDKINSVVQLVLFSPKLSYSPGQEQIQQVL